MLPAMVSVQEGRGLKTLGSQSASSERFSRLVIMNDGVSYARCSRGYDLYSTTASAKMMLELSKTWSGRLNLGPMWWGRSSSHPISETPHDLIITITCDMAV